MVKFMKNTISINLNRHFKFIYYNAKYKASPYLVSYVIKNKYNINRIGITTSKKIGNAVKRNKSKRLIVAAYTILEKKFPIGYDFVFVGRKQTPDVDFHLLYQHMEKNVNYLVSIINKKRINH